MSDDALGGWIFLVFWMVPNIAVAIFCWGATEPPQTRGWEAIKGFFGMAGSVVLFGLPHGFFWLFVFGAPFIWTFDKIDRHFGGSGVEGMPWK